jgi:cell division septation protein DedD
MRKSTAEQQSTGSFLGQRAGVGLRAKNSDDSRRSSMSGKRTSSRGWEVRLGALQVVVWLGLSIGAVFGSYCIGFLSGRYVGFETARAASGVDVPKLAVTDDIPDKTAHNMRGIYDQLNTNATIAKEVKDPSAKSGAADTQVAKVVDEVKGATAPSAAQVTESAPSAEVDPFLDVNYADAPSIEGSLLTTKEEAQGKGGEVRLLGQQAASEKADSPKVVPEAPKVPVATDSSVDTKKPTTTEAKNAAIAKAPKGATQVTKKVPPGYFVQVAAPKTLKEAEGVAKKLRGSGFPVVIEDFSTGKSPYFRVLVGPEDNKVQAERLSSQVKRESYISGKPFIRQSK